MDYSNQLLVLLNVLIAVVLSGVIGYERERSDKPAGFRTHMIVGAVSCLMISFGSNLIESFHQQHPPIDFRVDPLRIIEAIIVGVSFIGAGTILKSESSERIKYLTTAAGILLSASIGISTALQLYVLAVGVTLLAIILNYVLKKIEQKI